MEVSKIDQLAKLMEEHDLARVRLEEEDGSAVELERAQAAPVACAPVQVTPAAPVGAVPTATATQTSSDDGAAVDDGLSDVCAPMVGVFYAAPSPGAAPFVRVGSKVHKGDALCVIEAMKLMNEVTADRDGEVAEVCVADGDLVEYGRRLMRIR